MSVQTSSYNGERPEIQGAMTGFRFLYRLMTSQSRGLEQTCVEALDKDPKNSLALLTLTRLHYGRQSFDVAESLAKKAIDLDESVQEMYLIAASSAFRNGNPAEARRLAALALQSPSDDLTSGNFDDSFVFRALRRIPMFTRKLDVLTDSLMKESRHKDELLDWAKQVVASI